MGNNCCNKRPEYFDKGGMALNREGDGEEYCSYKFNAANNPN